MLITFVILVLKSDLEVFNFEPFLVIQLLKTSIKIDFFRFMFFVITIQSFEGFVQYETVLVQVNLQFFIIN